MARHRLATLAALAFALAVTSCGQAEGQPGGMPPAANRQSAVDTNEYVRRTGTADLFEIQAGNLALQKSDQEDVRALARMIVDDHTRATDTLKEAVAKTMGTTTPPTRLDNAHQAKLQQLQAANGAEFTRLYLDMQKQAHAEALALHRGYAASGDNAPLKVAAGEFASMVEKHLEEMERISGTRSAPPSRG